MTMLNVLLLGAATATALSTASVTTPIQRLSRTPTNQGRSVVPRTKPKCDALPGGFHWRYEDVPKMPNPTGYYWHFAELPKDVQDCWNFGPCTTKQAEAATTITVPGAVRKGD